MAIAEGKFRSIELVATLTGVPLYAAFSYVAVERFDIPLAGGLMLPVVRMEKRLRAPGIAQANPVRLPAGRSGFRRRLRP